MTTPRTLNEIFFGAIERWHARPVVMRVRRAGAWQSLSYRDLLDAVRSMSLGLGSLGIHEGDRVAILSENRPEWAITDYACLAARCTDVPIYPTLPARQAEYILRDSGACAVLLSSREQVEKVRSIRPRLPALVHMIAFDDNARGPDAADLFDL